MASRSPPAEHSDVSQAQPLVGLSSTRIEKVRFRYAQSVNSGFIEIADKRLTLEELSRIFARETGTDK